MCKGVFSKSDDDNHQGCSDSVMEGMERHTRMYVFKSSHCTGVIGAFEE